MSKLKEVISYILINYPHKSELSNARLTKMIYLSDWKCAIESGKQLTDIEWFFDNYGPYVTDVQAEIAEHEDLFSSNFTRNMYGESKTIFSMKNVEYNPVLSDSERVVVEHVIVKTRELYWDDFIKLVYSTHPVSSSSRYSFLNLVEKAKEYKRN